ncbi:hypothetical protein [Pseudomonas sp. DTU12.1]|uniref:hypothetical protein n=1 Tax=Pseudomonas sp. DTU12.1 TaxID=2654238 RepID=UPI00132EADA9|nr:hypothetical protein [Pseudomonas sp. DTU12.1]QHG24848.1 hypothetical protein GDV60_19150 [Pseudomonas sp. DTU12.1]
MNANNVWRRQTYIKSTQGCAEPVDTVVLPGPPLVDTIAAIFLLLGSESKGWRQLHKSQANKMALRKTALNEKSLHLCRLFSIFLGL